MEWIITSGIIIFSILVLYKNIKKSKNGECNCANCHHKCGARK